MIDSPLRAFLMVRSGQGEWVVTVCRDLGSVVQAWKGRDNVASAVGLLHVGFDRSPSHIYDEVASRHAKRLLMTASAKYALPASFVVSKDPVGFADGQGVYIGLQGWGYGIDDPSYNEVIPSAEIAAASKPQGWLEYFIAENPSFGKTLAGIQVFNDETYLRKENELDRGSRQKLGEYRLRSLVRTDCEDPCEIARASPPWLMDRELISLDLTVRASNVFLNNNIKTVRDLAGWTPDALLHVSNFGRKSLRDTVSGLSAALAEGPVGLVNGKDLSGSSRLLIDLRRSLLSFPERDRDVIARRLGFEMPFETLQQVADRYGVTRERIRQIESRGLQKWIRESFWDVLLVQKITRLLANRPSPLPVAGIEAVDEWFEGIGSHLVFFQNLIKVVCDDRICVVQIDAVHYLTFMTQAIWARSVAGAEDLLSSSVGRDWSESYARSLVDGLLPDGAKEFSGLLWDAAASLCHFSSNADGSRTLISYGRGAEQVVEALLAESPVPLHYAEIADIAKTKYGRDIEIRRAHHAAASVGMLFDRGVYGLMRHVRLNSQELSEICAEAEDIILSEPGRQWHCFELMGELLERLDREYSGLDKYIVNIALRQSQKVTWLGKMTWVAKDHESSEQVRIDIHQAIVAIVKSAGRPLKADEVMKNLLAVRGVNSTFAITALDPLIPMGSGIWGINDRDVPVKRADQLVYIDLLVEHLESKQSGMYRDEVGALLGSEGISIRTLFSILTQDSRLKVSMGGFVYLSVWGGPRRETVSRAVQLVLDEAVEPLQFEVLTQLVEQRIARTNAKSRVSAALQAIGAVYNDDARTWSKADPSSGDGGDDDEPPVVVNDSQISSLPPECSILTGSDL